MDRFEELTGPYTSVLSIDKSKLPSAQDVNYWTSKQFSSALTHDQSCMDYNTSFRQLIHVGYKIAAELGEKYFAALDANRSTIENNVKYNLLERHLKLLFINP